MNNRTRARQIIEAAQKVDELDCLYYFVEMDVPRSLRTAPDANLVAATYPAGWIPVVSLVPDPRIAEHYAHLLCALMEEGNRGRGIVFRVELTSRDVLDGRGLKWYVWGEAIPVRVDAICAVCGGVHRVTPGQSPSCPHAPALAAGAGMYGGNWWGGL